MTEQIPAQAVEAAARADYERHFRTGVPWEARSEGWRDYGRAIVRPIVEAAIPHLTPEGTQPGCTGASDCPAPATDDATRARLAAVIAECDRIEADSNAEMVLNAGGVSIWPSWTARKTAQRIRAVASSESNAADRARTRRPNGGNQ